MSKESEYILNPTKFGFNDKRAAEIIDQYYRLRIDLEFEDYSDEINYTLENICQTEGEADWFKKALSLYQ